MMFRDGLHRVLGVDLGSAKQNSYLSVKVHKDVKVDRNWNTCTNRMIGMDCKLQIQLQLPFRFIQVSL